VKDKRFEIRIDFNVKEVKDGVATNFFDNVLTYHDIGLDGVVAIEASLIEWLGHLNDVGVMQAVENGLGEKLSALGLTEKVECLKK